MTRTGLCVLLLALMSTPASGVYYGWSLYVESGYAQASAWTEVEFWEQYWYGWEPGVDATFSSNRGYFSHRQELGQYSLAVSVHFFHTPPGGDVRYNLFAQHLVRESWCEETCWHSWRPIGYSNASADYDDPNDPPPAGASPSISALNPGHGIAGQTGYIEIYGENFHPPQGGAQVTLDGQAVTITYLSDHQINVEYAGQSAGDKTLTVSTARGNASVALRILTGDPTPVITSISPDVWLVGQQTYFSVTGTGFGTAPLLRIECAGAPCPGIGGYGIVQATAWDQGFQAYVNISPEADVQEEVTVIVESRGLWGQGFRPQNPQQPNPPAGANNGARIRCGDERDALIQQYASRPIIGWVPRCSEFTQTARSEHFSYEELTRNSGAAWAILRPALTDPASSGRGLERWRELLGGVPQFITSGYRTPERNEAAGGRRIAVTCTETRWTCGTRRGPRRSIGSRHVRRERTINPHSFHAATKTSLMHVRTT